jgi:uncharacterized membrane protein YgdD (TMEM256/DUF423 family)
MTGRQSLLLGALLGATGVAAGAFGAHALRGRLDPADLAVYETAVRYQLYHSLALLGVSIWLEQAVRAPFEWAARFFALGVVLFSGSLYLLVLTGQRWLGAVTPLGGGLLIVGWLALAAGAVGRTGR